MALRAPLQCNGLDTDEGDPLGWEDANEVPPWE